MSIHIDRIGISLTDKPPEIPPVPPENPIIEAFKAEMLEDPPPPKQETRTN